MVRLLPFRALRYVSEGGSELGTRFVNAGARVTEAQRRAMSQWDRHHALHVRASANPHEVVRTWTEMGVLARDERPALYVLAMDAPVLGAVRGVAHYLFGLLAPDAGVAPLEAGGDTLLRPPVVPIPAVAADDHQALRQLLSEATETLPALLDTRFEDRHLRLYRVEGSPLQRRLQSVLADAPVRTLVPLAEGAPSLVGVAPLTDRALTLQPIHRAIRGVATFQPERFLTLVKEYARVLELDAQLTTAQGLAEARERLQTLSNGSHAVLLVLPGGRGKLLRFRQGLDLAHVPAAPRSPTLRSLDLALLNALVLRTVLGIPRPEELGHKEVFTVPTLEALVEGVEAGHYQAGFGLNAPPTWELRAVMEAQQQLPPKTLQVDPLPPDGLLFLSPEP